MDKFKQKIVKYKKYIICFMLIILSIISVLIQKNDRKQALSINNQKVSKKENKIGVYVTGEIKKPGVYYLDIDSRIDAAIDIAGGITENADISKINLSKKLVDSDKIVIPKKTTSSDTQGSETDVEENVEENEDNTGEETTVNSTDKININEASKEQLMELKGIGDATAEKIIEYRQNNKFEKIEDIMNVKGIGQSKFSAIKANICV